MERNSIPPFENIDVLTLLPQQPPFVMVDRLLACDDTRTVCSFTPQRDNLFCEQGVLKAAGVIENIAQSCAARVGFVNKYILRQAVQVGYIGAVRNLTIYREPRVGETLRTTVVIEESVMGMTLASARVEAADELIAETQIKIALAEQTAPTPQTPNE